MLKCWSVDTMVASLVAHHVCQARNSALQLCIVHVQSQSDAQHDTNAFEDVVGALGSPGFISPEIIIGEPHTYAMDVFAVGVILFVLLVGRKPFNIADSENLNYCAMKLADCPGIKDPRYHPTTCLCPPFGNMHGFSCCQADGCSLHTGNLVMTVLVGVHVWRLAYLQHTTSSEASSTHMSS